MKFLLSTVLSAFALSASAATIAPNAVAKIQLAGSNPGLCVEGLDTSVGSKLSLQPCTSDRTAFDLPRGAPTGPTDDPTQIALQASMSSGGPTACISARNVSIGGPLFLDVCEDDDFQRWSVETQDGQGPIFDAGAGNCLSASVGQAGASIIFSSCDLSATQQWVTIAN